MPFSTSKTFCLAMLLAPLVFADATVTATGSLFCRDRNLPGVGLRVELMDSDCDGSEICDDVMGVGPVAADGSFRVTGRGGDPLGGDPDVYLRFAYNDDGGVRMTDEADVTRSASTPQHDHNNTPDGSVIDFGAITIAPTAAPDESPRCQIFLAVRRAYRDYIDNVNPAHSSPPAGHIDILMWSAIWAGTAWTNTDTIHWPIDYRSSAAPHEFGHSVRHAADGSPAHFAGDVVAYRYARNHDNPCAEDANAQQGELLSSVRAYNFNEGWADYWDNNFPACPGILNDMGEASVAKYLRAYQGASGLTKMDMVNVLLENPGSIHNIDEFADKLAVHLGVARSPLTDRADALRRAAASTPASTNGRSYTQAQMSSLTQAALDAARQKAAELRRAAQRASGSREPRVRACKDSDCEVLFKKTIEPILLQGEADALDVYAAKLKEAASRRWIDQVQRVRAEGRFDAWFAAYRGDLQARVNAAMTKTLTKADTALARLRPQMSHAYDQYRGELAKARARLSSNGRNGFWSPQFERSVEQLRIALR